VKLVTNIHHVNRKNWKGI